MIPQTGNFKILHIIPSLGIGGTEKQLYLLCKNTKECYNEVIVLKDGKEYFERLTNINIPVMLLHSGDGIINSLIGLKREVHIVRERIKDLKPDIVMGWLTRACLVASLAKIALNVKFVQQVRVATPSIMYSMLDGIVNMFSDRIVVNSDYLKEFICKRSFISKNKVHVIKNAIEI